jgi:putative Mg2+ transporter-C (MgtC) family protein
MPLHPELRDICLRIMLTLVAGFLLGIDRSVHGKPAGIRTTMLVCMAASLSMIAVNLLLYSTGKTAESFNVLDLMRLPLGILSGMGFIGAGTILRRGNLVVGVTTAATLWFVTMLGICFGAGLYLLGVAGLGVGLLTLWGAKFIEDKLTQARRATIVLTSDLDSPPATDVKGAITGACYVINSWAVTYAPIDRRRTIRCIVEWRALPSDTQVPAFVGALSEMQGVAKLQWIPGPVN